MDHLPKYPPFEARARIKAWCDRQERAHSEVRTKLYSWQLDRESVESIISELILANYLNEERFATAFARGKFRIRHWGWKRIEQELKRKGVAAHAIAQAKAENEPEDYRATLGELLRKKALTIKAKNKYDLRAKLKRYAVSKGYSFDEVGEVMKGDWELTTNDNRKT